MYPFRCTAEYRLSKIDTYCVHIFTVGYLLVTSMHKSVHNVTAKCVTGSVADVMTADKNVHEN